MRKFVKDCKGAVTVFVTLLLIPAILISGTAVDTARIYGARSVLHDANQLAANSALASYDALLQDMYGLYGYLHSDQDLAAMVDEYIQVAVFGDNPPSGMGTFQLFYGSNLQPGKIQPIANQNLGNPAVLRRQIEEYVKFRAPVIIADRILDMLDKFEKTGADTKAIEKKLEIEEGIEKLDNIYEKLYDQIQVVNTYTEKEQAILSLLNTQQERIRKQFLDLLTTRAEYTAAVDADDYETAEDLRLKYDGLCRNIRNLVLGGEIQTIWQPGEYDDEGQWQDGYFRNSETEIGLEDIFDEGRDYIKNAKKALEKLEKYCNDAQKKKAELEKKISELEAQLNSGKCSEDLVNGMTKKQEGQERSLLESYRTLLGYDVAAMGQAVRQKNEAHLSSLEAMLNEYIYGKRSTGRGISLKNLKEVHRLEGFLIDLEIQNRTRPASRKIPDQLAQTVNDGVEPYYFSENQRFLEFQHKAFTSTKNPEFYQFLQKLCKSEGKSKKDAVKNDLGKSLKEIQNFFQKGFAVDLEGARYFRSQGAAEEGAYGIDGDWGDTDSILSNTSKALNDNLFDQLGDLTGMAADKVLLVTYCTQMFSNYATTSDPVVKSMAGIPMGVETNYFFQSEQEYLFAGHSDSAASNVLTVAGMLLLVRFVSNYIASFTITEVNNFVSQVTAAMAATGPFAPLFGELARVVIVLGESVLDVARLRTGCEVVLFKNNDTWKLSLQGLVDTATNSISTVDTSMLESFIKSDDKNGIGYGDYLCVFLLFLKSSDEIADRTADLIGWNITNYREGIGQLGSQAERESAMSQAEQFDMSEAITDFSITTTVDLRMLFLSMPVAQAGVNGVVPPGTLTISATDYRGY